jgi:hypothetical protein
MNGKYPDIQSMGMYLELLSDLAFGNDDKFFLNLNPDICPNPFFTHTNIVFTLASTGNVKVSLYDL